YEFKVYISNTENPHSLSGNEISALYEDERGLLWVGTNSGVLNKFDPKDEQFVHYDVANTSDWFTSEPEVFSDYPLSFSRNSINTITSIDEDESGELWIGTWSKGIVRFNPLTNSRKYYYYFPDRINSLSSNKITKLLVDSKNTVWIGTFGGGLNRIIPVSDDSIRIENMNEVSNYKFGDKITSLFEDSKGNIWVGSYDGNVTIIENKSESNQFVLRSVKDKFESRNKNNPLSVMSIVEDKNANIWLGTYGDGLYCYSLDSEATENFINIESDPYSLSDNEIQSLFVDKSGILWIGMQLGSGINKLEIGANKFNTIPIKTENHKSLNDNIIWGIFEDSKDQIWIGTHRGGINIWDRNKEYFEYYGKDSGINDNHIRSFAEDRYNNIWIGTYSNGLIYYNRSKNSFTNIKDFKNYDETLSGNQIQAMLVDEDSILYVGSFGGGLNILDLNDFYDSSKVSFRNHIHNPADRNSLSDNRIYTIFKDSDNKIWIGTHGGGINYFNKELNSFDRIHAQNDLQKRNFNNRIMTINETFDGDLLIGTFGGGLNLYEKSSEKLINLNDRINFNYSDVYGIIPNTSGFWLSTDN
ncbi:MAG: two-component regulator propeller domain-containing protein, partial [Melioribacteraceae bacterium]|nr:two-component regulator propeller domain-containing protein [Melioribacteraceae bacterium]